MIAPVRLLVALVLVGSPPALRADDAPKDWAPPSFMKDVAPLFVQNCIACHNGRKAESKYNMTTFAALAKGGQVGEGITLEPGKPEESYLVELLAHDADPRMPYKLDPLPKEQIAVIERWVKEGAKYDGDRPDEDWVALLHRRTPVAIPEKYPAVVPITALYLAPDGKNVVASGYHELTAWSVPEGTLGKRVQGLPERVYEVAASPDGKWLATAAGDPGQFGSAVLWSVKEDGTIERAKDLTETSDAVFAVAFSPDSKRLATAGADRAIRIYEVEGGKLVATIEDHADWILDLAYSPDGKRLATASRDKTSKVFDAEKNEALVTFPGHAQTVHAVVFSPDGKLVLSAGEDNQIRVWNPDDEAKQTKTIGGFGGPVFRLALSPDGKTLAACSSDKTVRLFEPGGKAIKTLEGHKDWVYTLAFAKDGARLASGGWDGEVRVWNVADGALVGAFVAAPGFTPPAK
jgi:tricorn protease-like protein